ncbi:MAG: tripartite tricarboxylate transporter substrate binding protein [Casimicrobiaceae bacterium]
MTVSHRRVVLCSIVLAVFMARPDALQAADPPPYPDHPVRIVVPFAPGGGTDLIARSIAQRLGERMGQPFVVENKPGAGGTIGTDAVAKARPDGYTLLMATNATLALAPGLYKSLPYDSGADLVTVALIASGPSVLVVNPSIPVKDFAEFLVYARANPGKLNYGSAGNGSMAHVATAILARDAGLDVVHIPFKGGAAAVSELVAGRLSFMVAGPVETLPLVQSGSLRALAITTAQRVPSINLSPIAAQGLPSYEISNWFAIMAPAATPAPIVERLNREINAILAQPEMRTALEKQGVEAKALDAKAAQAFVVVEVAKWPPLVAASGARAD